MSGRAMPRSAREVLSEAAATAAATAEAATRAIFLGTSFIDRQLTTTEIGAVQFFCC